MGFTENIEKLPAVDGIEKIVLTQTGEKASETHEIPNKPGKTGSLAVYNFLLEERNGPISREKAYEGLYLFGEHTVTARDDATQHPNIQILFGLSEGKYSLSGEIVYRA